MLKGRAFGFETCEKSLERLELGFDVNDLCVSYTDPTLEDTAGLAVIKGD